ncbi:MAG: hypothetical protein A2309_13580 [Bacteroidetes bacterium RIFOXYB2_FULL_35_7]|nr:MAG: hypothetical protein A2X01_04635 [Bacteroidetes bacterium GWF2_35_48]OFY92250.1 MAG: hypothetical protein A2309_13580 [Bacteroidetes bacterium RIFOXYB2_FULL_35_7]OFZ02746.1 MAG: hypothetical protein A2491_03365 [Bacteroidetes bacterium RIFOXYC12_FULL_35_7]HBX50955.1 septum formation initiator [Bacteroidales bacterium]
MKKILHILFKIIKNKYLVSLFAFGIWVTFFDASDMLSKIKMMQDLNNLKKEKNHFKEAINTDKSVIKGLKTDNNQLEKFAREAYFMKRKNEDIFIIIKD